jgi:hypothetical protein
VALLALSVVGVPVTLPLVDAGEGVDGAFVESRHDPGACLRLHDHAACSQLLHSFAGLCPVWLAPTRPAGARGPLPDPTNAPSVRPLLLTHTTRAPPKIAL